MLQSSRAARSFPTATGSDWRNWSQRALPDRAMTPWKRPVAVGIMERRVTEAAPESSPKMVTWVVSERIIEVSTIILVYFFLFILIFSAYKQNTLD